MSHRPTSKAAVDEGRDPYGYPGRGNGADVWHRLTAVPCPRCGATAKMLRVEGEQAIVVCATPRPSLWKEQK